MSRRILPDYPRGPRPGSDASIARAAIMRLAKDDSAFSAKDVLVLEPACGAITIQVELGKLAADGTLQRVTRGFYARPGIFPENTSTQAGPTTMARGENAAAARALEAAEAFLSSREPLPPARPPVFDAPRTRHGGVR